MVLQTITFWLAKIMLLSSSCPLSAAGKGKSCNCSVCLCEAYAQEASVCRLMAKVSRTRMLGVFSNLRDTSLCISNVFISRVSLYMTVYGVF